jgi:hypothetical protein
VPRYNKSLNPSAANNVTDWRGNSPTRITGLSGPPRSTGGRVTAGTGSFSGYISAGYAAGAAAGQAWTGVGYFRTSVARTVRYYFALWNNGSFVATTAANDVSATANQWYGYRVRATLPSGTYNEITFHLDVPTSASSSGSLDLSSVRLEQVDDATMEYGDGDSGSGWSWDGTAGNSTSTQQDVEQVTVADTGAAVDTVTADDQDAGYVAVEIREVLAAQGDSTTPPSVTTSTATDPEDLIVVVAGEEFATTSDQVPDPSNGPWTLVHESAMPATSQPIAKAWTRKGLSGAQTISITPPGADTIHMVVYVLSKAKSVAAAASLINTDDDLVHTAPGVSVAEDGSLYIGFWLANGADYTGGLSAHMVRQAKLTVGTDNSMISGSKYPPKDTTASATADFNTATVDNVAVSLVVNPAGVAVADTGAGADAVAVTETASLGDAGTAGDTVTVADTEAVTAADSGTGSDTVTAADVTTETITAVDTGAGSDTAVVDEASATADTATASDTATVAELATATDTAAGSDTATVVDPVDDPGDAGAARDHIAILDVPATRLLPHRAGPVYELMAVARIPAAVGPPMFIDIDPIRWTSLQYTNELSRAQSLEASCLVSTLPDSIKQRLHPKAPPTELWLLRNGEIVFAGPLGGGRRGEGGTLTLSAHGLLAYLRRMIVHKDLVFKQVDQFAIVAQLVEHWQDVRPFGHYGIDTSQVGTSGQLRDATYLRDELHPIGQRVEEMGRRINGFDIDVDPGTRRLQLWYPQRGMDRSDGEDAVVFDTRHITSGSVMFSFAPDDLATEGFGTGTSPDHDTVYSALPNEELRAQHGASAVTGNWDGVSQQNTLDEHVQALLDARQEALFVPSPNLRVTPDADLTAYAVGDTIAYDVDEQLGVTGAFRIRSQQVTVDAESGQESVSLQFT